LGVAVAVGTGLRFNALSGERRVLSGEMSASGKRGPTEVPGLRIGGVLGSAGELAAIGKGPVVSDSQ